MRFGGIALLALLAGCVDTVPGGTCGESAECPEAEPVCLFDVDRATSYCTKRCGTDAECPALQNCRIGVVDGTSGAEMTSLCVDRVRKCEAKELCDGLDDDCNGVVDDAGCELITGCLDDRSCGAFNCSPVANQELALCVPPDASATVPFYSDCDEDTDCVNGVCEAGFCSPLCRPRSSTCRSPFVCAGALGSPARPKHNLCQKPCETSENCDPPSECVWRETYQNEPEHQTVCALPNPERKALGQPCTNNEPDGGDVECAHGLCFGLVCSRVCGGPGSSCADVGANFECQLTSLYYGNPQVEFAEFLCVVP